jgi:hypothetical protein
MPVWTFSPSKCLCGDSRPFDKLTAGSRLSSRVVGYFHCGKAKLERSHQHEAVHSPVEWLFTQTGEPCRRHSPQLFRLQFHQDSSYTSHVPGHGCWRDGSALERGRLGCSLGSLRATEGGKSSVNAKGKRNSSLSNNGVFRLSRNVGNLAQNPALWHYFACRDHSLVCRSLLSHYRRQKTKVAHHLQPSQARLPPRYGYNGGPWPQRKVPKLNV